MSMLGGHVVEHGRTGPTAMLSDNLMCLASLVCLKGGIRQKRKPV